MPRENDGISGKCQNLGPDSVHQSIAVATEKVRAPDAASKEDVARKQCRSIFLIIDFAARIFTVKSKPSGRMPRHMEYAQLDSGNLDDIAVRKESAQPRSQIVKRQTEHGALLPLQVQQKSIGFVSLRLDPIGPFHERIAEDMVQMQVSVQDTAYLEASPLYISCQGRTFPFIARTGVYQYGIPRIITQYVGIDTKRIKNELLDLHSKNVEKRENYNGKMGKKGGMAKDSVLFPKKKLFF